MPTPSRTAYQDIFAVIQARFLPAVTDYDKISFFHTWQFVSLVSILCVPYIPEGDFLIWQNNETTG